MAITAFAFQAKALVQNDNMYLRLLVPFILGALFTLVITSVNHRRDHVKHVRDVISTAIKAVSHNGAIFWAQKYSDEAMVKLRGSVVYLQHVLPYALDSTEVDETIAQEIEELFATISHVALHTDNELNADSHEINIEKVALLSVHCARAEAMSNNMLLASMSLGAILKGYLVRLRAHSSSALKAAYNAMFVP
jgi:hypothetical protein